MTTETKAQHTPEPRLIIDGVTTAERLTRKLFIRPDETRRIAAAVNACKGIPTEALEGGVIEELIKTLRGYAAGDYNRAPAREALAKLEGRA